MTRCTRGLLLADRCSSRRRRAETLLVVRKTGDARRLRRSGLRPAAGVGGDRARTARSQRVARRPARGGVQLRHARAAGQYTQHRRPRSSRGRCGASTSRRTRRPHGVEWYARRSHRRDHRRLAAPAAGRSATSGRVVARDRDGAGDLAHGRGRARRRRAPTSPTSARARRRCSTCRRVASSRTSPPAPARRHSRSRPDGRELWVAARADGIDRGRRHGDARGAGARCRSPGIPIRIAFTPDGRTALVTCAGSGRTRRDRRGARASSARRAQGRRAAGARAPRQRPFARLAPAACCRSGCRSRADGRTAYVAATMGDRVVQFDAATLAPVRTIAVGGEPDGLGDARPCCRARRATPVRRSD